VLLRVLREKGLSPEEAECDGLAFGRFPVVEKQPRWQRKVGTRERAKTLGRLALQCSIIQLSEANTGSSTGATAPAPTFTLSVLLSPVAEPCKRKLAWSQPKGGAVVAKVHRENIMECAKGVRYPVGSAGLYFFSPAGGSTLKKRGRKQFPRCPSVGEER